MSMIIHYGYRDGSGEYYIVIDTNKCTGCGRCVERCPKDVLKLITMAIDLEDTFVAAVSEESRKNIKYTCSACKPENGKPPCVLMCEEKAIKAIWNPEK